MPDSESRMENGHLRIAEITHGICVDDGSATASNLRCQRSDVKGSRIDCMLPTPRMQSALASHVPSSTLGLGVQDGQLQRSACSQGPPPMLKQRQTGRLQHQRLHECCCHAPVRRTCPKAHQSFVCGVYKLLGSRHGATKGLRELDGAPLLARLEGRRVVQLTAVIAGAVCDRLPRLSSPALHRGPTCNRSLWFGF